VQPALARLTDKRLQRLAPLFTTHAVQVELRLHDPGPAPQLLHDLDADAGAVVVGDRGGAFIARVQRI
jgi:hypothetical protein